MNKHTISNILLILLFVSIIIAMAIGTVLQRQQGPATAIDTIYASTWFICLWIGLIALVSITSIRQKKWHNRPLTLVHISLLLILVGAIVTKFSSSQYQLQLFKGESSHELPFDVRLDDCRVLKHAGSEAAKNYSSILTISEPTGQQSQIEISVNHIGRYHHYRFYQMGYDPDGGSAILAAHDPWGIGFAYSGFGLLLVGFAWLMMARNSSFRKLLSKLALAALMLLPLGQPVMASTPQTLTRQQAKQFGQLYVSYHDRVCPLQSLAYNVTYQLYGKYTIDGLTPEQVLSGWMLYPSEWIEVPTKGGKHFDDQQALQQTLLEGRLFRMFPIADSTGQASWYSPADKLPVDQIDDNEYLFVRYFIGYCQELAFQGQSQQLDTLIDKLQRFQLQQAENQLPSTFRLMAEHGWNQLARVKPIAMGVTTLGIILFVYFIFCMGRGRSMRRWTIILGSTASALLGCFVLLLECLRWIAQGHIPLTNGFEIMLFLAMTLAVSGWLLHKRLPIAMPAGLLMAGLALMVAMMSGGDAVMTQMPPVLQSPLLCIHVSVIMLSYMLLSFVLLIALASLVGGNGEQERMRTISMLMLYPAVFLLAAGIIVGSVWANISWGSYWGWDPKEVWALISLMIYVVPLYEQHSPWFNKPRNYQIYCILAFLSVLITYFGVNLLLGGMHSYA